MLPVMEGLTKDELAARAGVTLDYVDRLIELGILTPDADAHAPFSAGDVRRVRFVQGLEEGGLPLDGMGTAVRNGDLAFRFFDTPAWDRFGGMSPKTFREVSAQTGIGLDLLQSVRQSIGFARPEPDDHVREDELDTVALAQASLAAGVDPGAVEQLMRVWGESVRRITEAEADFYHNQIEVPLLRSGLNESQMMEAATTASASIGPLLDQALLAMYHAQSEHTWLSLVVEAVEATLERAGLYEKVAQPPAMCFLDLSGYTRLTEERGDQAAAEMASSLGRLVQRSSHEHGGRPVKWLGDGVMVYFRQPEHAVVSALDMVDGASSAGLPPAHGGIDAGPVIFQDGDYFGRTVNLAARIAAHAGPGQVLVSDNVVEASTDPAVSFAEIGPVELKGVARSVRLHQANRNPLVEAPQRRPAVRPGLG
jgi:adenylate cyclase